MKRFVRLVLLFSIVSACAITLVADEGMYPLSELGRLDLRAKGLKIPVSAIWNPKGASLVDAICRVGGGTGSFVSPGGLILTNHHIAFAAVADASTPEHDYLRDGFTAASRDEEIPAKGYTCLITESYRDVSGDVLDAVKDDMSPAARATAIRDRCRRLADSVRAGRSDVSCETAEMFPDRSYVLFTYREIRDVRLVYVPPRSVGEYGGEADNWMWPRHTGDFSFLRAYVAPDGSSAAYAKSNVPFKPKRWIRVDPHGVREGDFVMLLGYPGRTYRHKTSRFLRVQESVQLPTVSRIYDQMIAAMQEAAKTDKSLELLYADRIKSLANTTKNYKGKLLGLHRLHLVEARTAEEAQLQSFIDADTARRAKYGALLGRIGEVYARQQEFAAQEIVARLLSDDALVSLADAVLANAERAGRTEGTDSLFTVDALARFGEVHLPTEKKLLQILLAEVRRLPETQQFTHRYPAVENCALSSPSRVRAAAIMPKGEAEQTTDPILGLARDVSRAMIEVRKRQSEREAALATLEADLLDVTVLWKKSAYIPDANRTLRFTYGYVRGYSPADATWSKPFTTLRGVVEKNRDEPPFDAPRKLLDLARTRRFDPAFEDPALHDVPVCLLYNLDTTGGNSGSPLFDDDGNLVGVNFDRTFEATVNDYAWSEAYSRSIAVDIRYVLFITKYLGGAEYLLHEMGVKI